MPLRYAASGRCRGFREVLQLTILKNVLNVHASALPLRVHAMVSYHSQSKYSALVDVYQVASVMFVI